MQEMDAALASLEVTVRTLQADARTKGNQLVADLKKHRDHFKATAKEQAEAGEAAWEHARAELESQWNAFEAQVKTYFETIGKDIRQHHATFQHVAAAQANAWRETLASIQESANKLAAGKRVEVDAAIGQIRLGAEEAEGRVQKLNRAGSDSWSALNAALAESRKAFDKASEKAWHAFHSAAH
jgi:hypothetical protein